MRRELLFQRLDKIYAQAGIRLYLTNLVQVLSETYEPRELKELAVIEWLVFAKGALC